MLRVNGLFGHIQRNNAKTFALLALFLFLLEATQFTVRFMGTVMHVNLASQLSGQFENIRAPDPHETSIKPPPRNDGGLVEFKLESKPGQSIIQTAWEKFRKHATFFTRDWYLLLIIGVVYVAITCWWSARLMAYETRARPLARKDAPDLYNLVENLALSIGLRCPRIEVIESPALNAYAAGFFPSSSTIAVTRGLIQSLTRDELEAVLAHELVHIRDRDVRLLVMARACVDLVLPISKSAFEQAKAHPYISGYGGILLVLYMGPGFALMFAVLLAVLTVMAFGVRFAISRTREFTADAGAVDLTKNPAALITALRKVARSEVLPLKGYAIRAMMFSPPVETFLATHPPIDERIAAIKLHTGVGEHEIPDVRPRKPHLPVAAEPASAFGRRRIILGLRGEGSPSSLPADPISPPATASTVPAVFGQRPATTRGPTPGQRPIAEPPVSRGVEERAKDDWFGRWIASGRADRITGGAVKVLMMPHMFAAGIGMFGMAIALVTSLAMVNPLLGLAAALVIIWWAWKRFMKWISTLVRRLANA